MAEVFRVMYMYPPLLQVRAKGSGARAARVCASGRRAGRRARSVFTTRSRATVCQTVASPTTPTKTSVRCPHVWEIRPAFHMSVLSSINWENGKPSGTIACKLCIRILIRVCNVLKRTHSSMTLWGSIKKSFNVVRQFFHAFVLSKYYVLFID